MLTKRYHLVSIGLLWLLLLSAGDAFADDPASEEFFEKRVRPVLAGTCFRCHGGQKTGGELRVDSREALVRGGESGAAIDLTKPKQSLLLAAIRREDNVSAMPPDKPLAASAVADLTAWITAGAPWPKDYQKFDAAPHWAFQPLRRVLPPSVQDASWPRTSIDPFILAPLEAVGRKPALAADRRTLLRRVTYDLTGLPPTAEEVAAFEQDRSPRAYAAVVERLLDSPAYGEDWGRHWLDVVRYADTAGENSDHPLPHAWKYRNWVIEAFNRDLPYDQFLREQIAGDLLAAEGPPELAADRIIATGYLAIARRFGHDIDKDMHLTLEDTLDTLGKSVLGLSIGCCRCHDHKFDALSVEDYYGLYGIFESTKFAFPGCEPQQQPRDLVPLPLSTEASATAQRIDAQLLVIDAEINRLSQSQVSAAKQLSDASALAKAVLAEGQIDDAKEASLTAVDPAGLAKIAVKQGEVLQLVIEPRGNHGADSTLVELEIVELTGDKRVWSVADLLDDLTTGNPHADTHGNAAVWCFLDLQGGTRLLPESLTEISGKSELHAWRNGDTPSVFVNRATSPVSVWTALPPRKFFVHPGPQGPVAVAWVSPVDATVSIRGRIADAHPGGPDGVAWRLEHLPSAAVGKALVDLGGQREKLTTVSRQKAGLLAQRPATPVAYAVSEGTPHHARIQKRGEPTDLGAETPRKFLDALGGDKLPDNAGSGRLELANWLTAQSNPLTPRVIVNRVWQQHFGRGLVTTPNDFGTRGTSPTHPELLDFLASELVKNGWSLKSLHRQIVLSATYQQSTGDQATTALYGAFQRRRLSAEELRDTLLIAGESLDRTPGGAHPFPAESTWSFTQHGPFAAEYETNRRSVYVMQKRNRRLRFFTLFDGADPNSSTPQRDVTTVPTQALYFLNDPLVHAQAAKLAARAMASGDNDRDRLNKVYGLLLGRPATDDEQQDAKTFFDEYALVLADRPAAEHPALMWQAYARVLLSSSEVLHVD